MKNLKLLKTIVNAADDKHAEDIVILDVQQLTAVADQFVIMQADSQRQVQAIAEEIEEKVTAEDYQISQIDGKNSKSWILIDLGDVIVHIFQTETRKFYNLEKLWSQAPQLDLGQLTE
ncbi:MAG: ribosome silencing factor [Liquorilactobacillus ghanensis]|uniref:ribosome silencing factor n=2 Tax=Liquorilactobacillus ghanensis TaxID=399370 RepID=UPI0039E86534